MEKNSSLRQGFHVVEALLEKDPSNIKKIFIPASREDKRISILTAKACLLYTSDAADE